MAGRYWHIAQIAAMRKEISQPVLGNFASGKGHAPASMKLAITVQTAYSRATNKEFDDRANLQSDSQLLERLI